MAWGEAKSKGLMKVAGLLVSFWHSKSWPNQRVFIFCEGSWVPIIFQMYPNVMLWMLSLKCCSHVRFFSEVSLPFFGRHQTHSSQAAGRGLCPADANLCPRWILDTSEQRFQRNLAELLSERVMLGIRPFNLRGVWEKFKNPSLVGGWNTQLKNLLVKLGSSSPGIGVKTSKIFETATTWFWHLSILIASWWEPFFWLEF